MAKQYVYIAEKLGFGDYQPIGYATSYDKARAIVKRYINHYGLKNCYDNEPVKEGDSFWYWADSSDPDGDRKLSVRKVEINEKGYWEN